MTIVVALAPRRTPANSVTIEIAVGKQPPRPTPAKNRNRPMTSAFGANAVRAVSNENVKTDHNRRFRRPKRLVTLPEASAPIIMPTSPAEAIQVPEAAVTFIVGSSISDGRTVPSTTASKPSKTTANQHSTGTHNRERVGVAVACRSSVDMGIVLSRYKIVFRGKEFNPGKRCGAQLGCM